MRGRGPPSLLILSPMVSNNSLNLALQAELREEGGVREAAARAKAKREMIELEVCRRRGNTQGDKP